MCFPNMYLPNQRFKNNLALHSASMEQTKPWNPEHPVSKGAIAYHDAVVDAQYYVDALQEFVRLVKDNIHENDVVVDFGAGTGVSAVYLLQNMKFRFRLWLVDNSAAWLGKAYDIFKGNPNVQCYLLDKIKNGYQTLADVIGVGVADKVISANTVHLIPDIEGTFRGVNEALKPNASFVFQSGNIPRDDREEGMLLIDDTIKRVHDIAINLIKTDSTFEKYRNDIDNKVKQTESQRKFVFPDPRPLDFYIQKLKGTGFKYVGSYFKDITIKYSDWLDFMRVKRLQAGILPEIGGIKPTPEEIGDRNDLITKSAHILFKELEETNPLADDTSFKVESVQVSAVKSA